MSPHNLVLLHYQEVGLKGKNRSFFERKLVDNIGSALSDVDHINVRSISGRILVGLTAESNIEAMSERLERVFGLSSFSPAIERPAQMDALIEGAIELANVASFRTFRVRARRGNSSFPETSQTVNERVGQALKDHTYATVDLKNAEWTCYIELVTNKAYMYSEKIPGPGGLPVGSSGRVLALLSGGIDSPVAAWQIAKRGASVDFIHFHGQPFSDPSSVRQATRLTKQLKPWVGRSRLWLVPFGSIQSEIVKAAPQELRIVLYRRFMMRIAEALAAREGAEALVTGESLGQVASQTLPNLKATNEVVEDLPVLRPLIGHDKIEIEAIAKRIGTYEISIDPHQDCCVLFIPRKVATAAKSIDLQKAESDLDVEGLVHKGLDGTELAKDSIST